MTDLECKSGSTILVHHNETGILRMIKQSRIATLIGISLKACAAHQDRTPLSVFRAQLLAALYPGEVRDLACYVIPAERIQAALRPHLVSLLRVGLNIVLDFPANTRKQRPIASSNREPRHVLRRRYARHELGGSVIVYDSRS